MQFSMIIRNSKRYMVTVASMDPPEKPHNTGPAILGMGYKIEGDPAWNTEMVLNHYVPWDHGKWSTHSFNPMDRDDMATIRKLRAKWQETYRPGYAVYEVREKDGLLQLASGISAWPRAFVVVRVGVTPSEQLACGMIEPYEAAQKCVNDWNCYLRGEVYEIAIEEIDENDDVTGMSLVRGPIFGEKETEAELNNILTSMEAQ